MAHVRGGAFQPALRRGDAQDYRLFAYEVHHAREERNDSLPARVHDAGLLQHGKLLGRVGERSLGGLIGGAQHTRRVRRAIRRVNGLRRSAHHAQHRALNRIADGLVACIGCRSHRPRERCAVRMLAVRQPAREPLHELGEDDAAVATSAEQRSARDRAAHRTYSGRRRIRQFGGRRRAKRQQHVDARIAVRHREDVEGIDGVGVGLQALGAGEDESPEALRVERRIAVFVHGSPAARERATLCVCASLKVRAFYPRRDSGDREHHGKL